MLSSAVGDDITALKKENLQLRRMVFDERKKSIEEREKRLRLETWFREHLHQCKTKIGEPTIKRAYSDAAAQTCVTLLKGRKKSPLTAQIEKRMKHSYVSRKTGSSSSSSLKGQTYRSATADSFSAVSKEDQEKKSNDNSNERLCAPLRKKHLDRKLSCSAEDGTYSASLGPILSSLSGKSFAPTVYGKRLYFIDMDGVIRHTLDVNPKAVDHMKTFVKRSLARQRRIKDASLLRQQVALEKRALVSKLLSGEAQAEDALPVFGKPPISAFSTGRIAGETKARFQKTAEYRKNQAAQLEIAHRKWNRLHALCFSEALRLRSSSGGFRSEFGSQHNLTGRLSRSATDTRK